MGHTSLNVGARHLFLQLSDIHLLSEASGRLRSGATPLVNLDLTIEAIAASPSRPEALILTGDLTDDGDPVAYSMLRDRIDALCARIGCAAVYVPGNHDDRFEFRRHLLGEPASSLAGGPAPVGSTAGGPAAAGHTTAAAAPIHEVNWFGDARIVTLDTNVPGADGGVLQPGEMEWLSAELANSRAPGGTILALHHPPISSPIEPMAGIALAEPEQLEEVIEGSDVCLVICGHNHHATSGVLGRVPVFVAPAIAYRADAMIEKTFVGRPGSAYARIDLIDQRPLVTVVPVVS